MIVQYFLVSIQTQIGTKNVKQCIEFYYMPKVNYNSRTIGSTVGSTGTLAAKRKRLQMIKTKQTKQIDDVSSTISLNEFRLVCVYSYDSNLTRHMFLFRI
jgi:hypothetical protein